MLRPLRRFGRTKGQEKGTGEAMLMTGGSGAKSRLFGGNLGEEVGRRREKKEREPRKVYPHGRKARSRDV